MIMSGFFFLDRPYSDTGRAGFSGVSEIPRELGEQSGSNQVANTERSINCHDRHISLEVFLEFESSIRRAIRSERKGFPRSCVLE